MDDGRFFSRKVNNICWDYLPVEREVGVNLIAISDIRLFFLFSEIFLDKTDFRLGLDNEKPSFC